jgi:general stress protein 26
MTDSCRVWYGSIDIKTKKDGLNMNEQAIVRAGEILKSKSAEGNMGAGVAISLIDSEGYPTTSSVSISKSDGIRQITFCTTMDSNKAKRTAACNRASVCVFDDNYEGDSFYNITLVGEIEIVSDLETKKEMWYEGMAEHCSGYDDANFCVLRFTTKRYNLWVCGLDDEGTTGSFEVEQ